ncbi:hypothetical protein [Actinoplanes philippinensis]|uniref:hypothetical protein n=1 Tax=Actinoplanes philippinensis TaxID=35752 RepID=UPI0011607F6E|nr:hypothetical protein [Actinoplanes philippinensis]
MAIALVLGGLLGAGPARAAHGGVVTAGSKGAPTPTPTSEERPEAVAGKDLRPRRANVGPDARPPVAVRKQSRTTAATGCGGVARFGKIYHCSSLSGSRQDTFTVTTSVSGDVLYGTVTETANNDVTDSVSAMVYDAEGNYLCYYGTYPGSCELGAAGTYTIVVALAYSSGDMAYTLSVQSQRTPSACRTLGSGFFSFASPGRTAELALGSAGECFSFTLPVGSVLQMYAPRSSNGGDVRGHILNAEYQPVCPVQDTYTCTLDSPGPFRLMMYEMYGHEVTYTLRMSQISHSRGCPVLRPTAFGVPGSAAGSGTLDEANPVTCHQLRTSTAGGVAVRIHDDQSVWWNLYDDAGLKVCDKYENAYACPLPVSGNYTIVTSNQGWEPVTYQIAVAALNRSAGCATGTSLRWDEAAALLHQTSPVQTNCQQFQGAAGQRVVVYAAPTRYNSFVTTVVDSTGRALCLGYSEETGCLLPADGTYRVISYLDRWDAESVDETYEVQVRSLSAPKGCPVVTPGAYNDPPAGAYGPIRCRTVRLSEAGIHRIRAYDDENYPAYAAVFDSTGHRICNDSGRCEFPAAGDYAVVLSGQSTGTVIDNDFSYALSVLPEHPVGCPVSAQELYRATFTAPGQFLCLQLPQTTGQRIVEMVPAEKRYPPTQVYDADGNYLCDSSYALWQTSCQLTGTAPYFAVMSQQEGEAPGPVAARFYRVDGPPSCPAFDGAALTLTTGGDDFSVCRTIPADAHAARESFTWKRTAGAGGAYLSVFGADGIRHCGPTGTFAERTATCNLPAGPLTVILDATEAAATFELSRKP